MEIILFGGQETVLFNLASHFSSSYTCIYIFFFKKKICKPVLSYKREIIPKEFEQKLKTRKENDTQ